VNPILDHFNLAWRTVNLIPDHFHAIQPVDPERRGSKTTLLVTAREPRHQSSALNLILSIRKKAVLT
jgi:hypothetical protein